MDAITLTQLEAHTAGPWDDLGHDGKTAIIVSSKWGEVARVRSQSDAKLIAASPEMLTEIKNLRAALVACRLALITHGGMYRKCQNPQLIKLASKALGITYIP